MPGLLAHFSVFSLGRRALSSVGLERTPDKGEVAGSNPAWPTRISFEKLVFPKEKP